MSTVAEFPTRLLRLDANGIPLGHDVAKDAAVREFQRMANELPETAYHLGYDDALWIAGQMILRYLGELEKEQRR